MQWGKVCLEPWPLSKVLVFTYCLYLHKNMNWTLMQEMSILLGYLCVDKALTCLCQNSVLFLISDIDLDWLNGGEKQPLPFPGCTAHSDSFGMCLIEFGLCKTLHLFSATLLGFLHTNWSLCSPSRLNPLILILLCLRQDGMSQLWRSWIT